MSAQVCYFCSFRQRITTNKTTDRRKNIDRDKSGGEETKANTKTETKKETERQRGGTAIVKNMSTFQVIQFETKLAEITIPASKMRDGENRFVS